MSAPPRPSRGLLPGLLLAVSLHAFHAMAVVTVVPRIAEELDGRALYGAFFSAYLLASLVGLVWAGGAFERAGARRVLATSLGVFAAGLVGSALAPSMPLLVAARVLEGLGGGGVSSVLYAIVNRAYPEPERPRVLAWMSGAWVLPGLLGPPLAGLIADLLSWRFVFIGVLPAVLASAAMTLPALPGRRAGGEPGERDAGGGPGAPSEAARSRNAGPAVREALALALGVGLALLGLSRPPGAASLLATVGGLALLVVSARRILPPGTLIARVGLAAAIATKFLANFVFFGAEAFLPLALRELLGFDLVAAGTVLTASALTWTTGAFLHSRLAAATSPRLLATAGSAAILAGVAGVAMVASVPTPPGFAHAVWGLAGLGMGLAFNTATTEAMNDTAPGSEGRTSAALGIADSLGFALSAGIGGAILAAGERAGMANGGAIVAICVVMGAIGMLLFATSARVAPAGAWPRSRMREAGSAQ